MRVSAFVRVKHKVMQAFVAITLSGLAGRLNFC